MSNIYKYSEKETPSPEEIALYVETLKLHNNKGKITDEKINKLIQKLPYPSTIRNIFSEQECKVVFESVNYAWKKLTGKDILDEQKIDKNPKGMEGSYWMISNGITLGGVNHTTIIKQNLNLFSTILDVSSFVLHERISGEPNRLIKTVLDHGGMRIFVNKDNKGYFQLSDNTYSKWGRNKIKKLNMDEKIVKIIDKNTPYRGWESGVLIKL